jgi:hypothetical protein
MAHLDEKDIHRWVFAHNLTPEVECTVRTWLVQHLDVFYFNLQVMYIPHITGPTLARTHIVLNNTPLSTSSMARGDEAVEVDARGMNARDAVKALIKATGLNPHLSVCGWPFCLGDLDGVDDAHTGGGAA